MTERLADLQYVALVLFALLGMSYDVIGAHMGLTLPKLERRLLGGRGRLSASISSDRFQSQSPRSLVYCG